MARERKETYTAHMNKKMWRDDIYSSYVSNSRDVYEDGEDANMMKSDSKLRASNREDERMWDVKMRSLDVKVRKCEMRRCEEAEKRWEGVKMRRCQDGRMWRWEDDTCGCQDDTVTHARFHTQTLFHTEVFTHRSFHTHLRTGAFTHRHFYAQTLLQTDPFTHTRFYT